MSRYKSGLIMLIFNALMILACYSSDLVDINSNILLTTNILFLFFMSDWNPLYPLRLRKLDVNSSMLCHVECISYISLLDMSYWSDSSCSLADVMFLDCLLSSSFDLFLFMLGNWMVLLVGVFPVVLWGVFGLYVTLVIVEFGLIWSSVLRGLVGLYFKSYIFLVMTTVLDRSDLNPKGTSRGGYSRLSLINSNLILLSFNLNTLLNVSLTFLFLIWFD